jgi:integrase
MIKASFSRRHKRKVYLLDITPAGGKRFRKFFLKKSDAEAVEYKIKHDPQIRRYGLSALADRPLLSELIAKRLASINKKAEHSRAKRVLEGLQELLGAICVDEVTTDGIQLYVQKRQRDGLKNQSVDRELNIIAAMLNQVDLYYKQLAQWRPPRMPRPKIIGGRRERIWSDREIKAVLSQLYEPAREGEQSQAVIARVRVGRRVQFCLLNGIRTGELAAIRKPHIDWQAKQVRIEQGKTGNVKVIGPLGPASMEILKEFCEQSDTDHVFFQGRNITPKFYRILREGCERAGVLYGRDVPGGLRLYDARHTATTHLLDEGVSPATVKDWMGWSDSAFVLYYSHATRKSRARAGRALERLAGKKIA